MIEPLDPKAEPTPAAIEAEGESFMALMGQQDMPGRAGT